MAYQRFQVPEIQLFGALQFHCLMRLAGLPTAYDLCEQKGIL